MFRSELDRFMPGSPERAMILWIIDNNEKFKWLFFIPAKKTEFSGGIDEGGV